MRETPPRGDRGRFLGRTGILEFVPRLTAKAAARLVGDPRGCAYAVAWRAEDSIAGRFDRRIGEEYAGRMERHEDGILVTIAGRSTLVKLRRTTPFGNRGWFLLFHCPGCGRTTAVLYLTAGLRCRRCAGLRWGCEGRRRFRLERAINRIFCNVAALAVQLGEAPVFPRAGKLEEKPWEARVRPLAGPLLAPRPKKRGRRPRMEEAACQV